MRDLWLELVDRMLGPARPNLRSCVLQGEQFRAALAQRAQQRARARSACEARIEQARAAVFAADDGVVTSLMNDLEREWRRLSRFDPDDGMMDFWARLAPSSWLDRKRWRHSQPAAQLDAAIALAADVRGVETAEAAVAELAVSLAPWGVTVGEIVRWRAFDADVDPVSELLASPLQAALQALAGRSARPVERARELESAVLEAAISRFPDRPLLARALAHAARVDYSFEAAAIVDRPNPVTALRALWATGYTPSGMDSSGVTLEIPPLV